jgi:CDP-diacylglycerol--glycerol-3-phosphate 3-phosphatidyltransferase
LVRVTYFLLFTIDGILPAAGLVIVLWREFSILFLRNLMLRKGVTMGARWGGKIKAVAYMLAGVFALLASSVQRLDFSESLFSTFRFTAIAVYAVSIALAILSFADYLREYRKAGRSAPH